MIVEAYYNKGVSNELIDRVYSYAYNDSHCWGAEAVDDKFVDMMRIIFGLKAGGK